MIVKHNWRFKGLEKCIGKWDQHWQRVQDFAVKVVSGHTIGKYSVDLILAPLFWLHQVSLLLTADMWNNLFSLSGNHQKNWWNNLLPNWWKVSTPICLDYQELWFVSVFWISSNINLFSNFQMNPGPPPPQQGFRPGPPQQSMRAPLPPYRAPPPGMLGPPGPPGPKPGPSQPYSR